MGGAMKTWMALAAAIFLSACDGHGPSDNDIYTLYRSSPGLPGSRIHVATFDAEDTPGSGLNQVNCQIVAEALAKRPGVTTQFWCEMGKYRP